MHSTASSFKKAFIMRIYICLVVVYLCVDDVKGNVFNLVNKNVVVIISYRC